MTTVPKWTILIATLGQRRTKFEHLMMELLPQVDKVNGLVTVHAFWNNGERPLSYVRQDLLESAESEYVSFVDDDDGIPDYFVSKVLPLLDGVDYIGWMMQCYASSVKLNPTEHSLKHNRWWSDSVGYYRDLSHLNPIKREIALLVNYKNTSPPEDASWVEQMRGKVNTEHFIDDIMYYYYSTSDSTWRGGDSINRQQTFQRANINNSNFKWIE